MLTRNGWIGGFLVGALLNVALIPMRSSGHAGQRNLNNVEEFEEVEVSRE
jgi:hypothetical protein